MEGGWAGWVGGAGEGFWKRKRGMAEEERRMMKVEHRWWKKIYRGPFFLSWRCQQPTFLRLTQLEFKARIVTGAGLRPACGPAAPPHSSHCVIQPVLRI